MGQTTIKSRFAPVGEPRERAAGDEPRVLLSRFDEAVGRLLLEAPPRGSR